MVATNGIGERATAPTPPFGIVVEALALQALAHAGHNSGGQQTFAKRPPIAAEVAAHGAARLRNKHLPLAGHESGGQTRTSVLVFAESIANVPAFHAHAHGAGHAGCAVHDVTLRRREEGRWVGGKVVTVAK